MGLKIEYKEGYVLVTPNEEIEVYIVECGNNKMVMNLENVEYIDSSGLGALVTLLKKLRSGNGKLVLVNTKSSVKQILGLTNLDKVFIIENSMESAIDALGR